jgi:hypothetical protein
MPATVGHILENVLLAQEHTENDGVIALVRPDFSVRIKSEAIKPNSSPARVELDTRRREIRVWIDDREGSSRPNRTIKNGISANLVKRKVVCSKCNERDVDEFSGTDRKAWGCNGWHIEDGVAVCPACAAAVLA